MDVVLEDGQVVKWKKPKITIPYKHGESERVGRISDPYNIQVSSKPNVTTGTVGAISKNLSLSMIRAEPCIPLAAANAGSSILEKLEDALFKDESYSESKFS